MWRIFKNCVIPNYHSQLLKLRPKCNFLFSEFFCQGEGVHSIIIYWNKINSFKHKNLYNRSYSQITLFQVIDMFPGNICDISYSKFLEGYISNNNKKSKKWVYNWQMKWQLFYLMDNTPLSFYLMACKIGKICKC